jgi:hypothetical protein
MTTSHILVTGDILKPSDERIKTNITPLSPSSQLENVEKLRLYEYELKHSVGPDGQPVRERGGKFICFSATKK